MEQIKKSRSNKKSSKFGRLHLCNLSMVRAKGFEPPTFGTGNRRSIQLSYARIRGIIIDVMRSDKEELRAQLKQTRQQMPEGTVDMLSKRITDQVIDLVDWDQVLSMHIYQPIKQFREVNTEALMEYIRSRYPGIAIASWEKADKTHTAHWLTDGRRVPKGFRYDLIIVPLLGFNDQGHRLGFGGGFYDRFLKDQKQAQTIGLGFASDTVQFEPEAHDVALDFIVTENNTYFRQ